MNKSKLKSYAPQARKDFIAAVTARANLLGLSEAGGKLEVTIGERKGDIAIIAGREWPAKVFEQRERLIKHIKTVGFSQTMEAVAYTWFNRFAALRYMDIHDYLDHGHRVLSNRAGGMPEILNHATELELPGYNKAKAVELKLAGNKDGELYKMLLVAQCNALSNAMPFLFERIDDETELLLADNLLRTDSIIAKLVEAIPEEDWQEVEIIGWLYQFYISEKKDEVIGKVVKSDDIPAATQLFTPNWIVQYLVQNSVGRLWLMANPASTLKSQWPYYIQTAEQTPDVGAALAAITQARMDEDGGSLNPETITVLDPACGSGHILVVAYDVLKAIYLERGYQLRAIPRLILEKNLYGLDIDDRAAQLAGFALLMKARADDRRLFTATDDAGNLQPPKLNVLSLQESKGLSVDELATHLTPFKVQRATITALVETFEHAKTFGSLIQIPYALKTHLAVLPEVLALVKQSGDMYATAAADDLLPLVQQAQVLAMQFDAVVANPPYMGGKGLNTLAKEYVASQYPNAKSDLFACFIERGYALVKPSGFNALVTMQSWMFLSSFQKMRERLLREKTIVSMAHLGPGGFDHASAMVVQTTAFVLSNQQPSTTYKPTFFRLMTIGEEAKRAALINREGRHASTTQAEFQNIPGSPLAYWLASRVFDVFRKSSKLGNIGDARMGLATGNNDVYVRLWFECSFSNIGFEIKNREEAKASEKRWFPYSKGGLTRKWYGNNEYVVDWLNDGQVLQTNKHPTGRIWAHNFNLDHIFQDSITWTDISTNLSVRFNGPGFLFDGSGTSAFFKTREEKIATLGLLNSTLANELAKVLNPTFHFQSGDFRNVPYNTELQSPSYIQLIERAVEIARQDWSESESTWDFGRLSLLGESSLELAWEAWSSKCESRLNELTEIEFRNNTHVLEVFNLENEFSTSVPNDQVVVARADREKDCQRLISYAIGCMMGRYSLDEPGLIYAHAGNVGFEPGRYATFPADADGIVPLTDELWFVDDACSRIREFLRAVWGPDTLEENMAWLAESLGTKASETPEETIRRYIADKFFKDHLQTYKKRPIYWLFSSGKQGAFQALVYLHRYHEGTLARMRSEYVVPLTGKIQSRIEMLTKDAEAATVTAARNKLNKEIEGLRKKHVELLSYDEKLRHYADMRITLDLDDGVKVNYGKFGDLLAEVKAVTGGASAG